MAKVVLSPSVTRQKGYVMTSRDLCWTLSPDGEAVFVPNGKRGRPAKVRAVCVRWTCGQAYTYSWNPALRREATEGMKRSQGQMKEAVALAKTIWADPIQKASWQKRYKRQRSKYKSAWLMVVAACCNNAQCKGQGQMANVERAEMRRIEEEEKRLIRGCEEVATTLHVPIKIQKYRFRSPRSEKYRKSGCEVNEKGKERLFEGCSAGGKGVRAARQMAIQSRNGKKNISFPLHCGLCFR